MARKVQKEKVTRFEVSGRDIKVCVCGACISWIKTAAGKWRPCMTYVVEGKFVANTEHPHPPRVCEARAAAAALEDEAPANITPSADVEWNAADWRRWAREAITKI